MVLQSRRDYLAAIRERYRRTGKRAKTTIPDEFTVLRACPTLRTICLRGWPCWKRKNTSSSSIMGMGLLAMAPPVGRESDGWSHDRRRPTAAGVVNSVAPPRASAWSIPWPPTS